MERREYCRESGSVVLRLDGIVATYLFGRAFFVLLLMGMGCS
jgi:hypothetical protein